MTDNVSIEQRTFVSTHRMVSVWCGLMLLRVATTTKNVHHNLMKSQWKKLIAYIYKNPDGVMYGGRFELHAHSRVTSVGYNWYAIAGHKLSAQLWVAQHMRRYHRSILNWCNRYVRGFVCAFTYFFNSKWPINYFTSLAWAICGCLRINFCWDSLLSWSGCSCCCYFFFFLLHFFFPPSLFICTLCLAPNFTRHFQHSAAANKITWMKIT